MRPRRWRYLCDPNRQSPLYSVLSRPVGWEPFCTPDEGDDLGDSKVPLLYRSAFGGVSQPGVAPDKHVPACHGQFARPVQFSLVLKKAVEMTFLSNVIVEKPPVFFDEAS